MLPSGISAGVNQRDGAPRLQHEFCGIGLMQGNGYLKLAFTSREGKLLKIPFLYLIQPSLGGSFWSVVNGAERDNRWFIIQGPRAERIVKSVEQVVDRTNDEFII